MLILKSDSTFSPHLHYKGSGIFDKGGGKGRPKDPVGWDFGQVVYLGVTF